MLEKLKVENSDLRVKNGNEVNEMPWLTNLQLENNEQVLKMAMYTKLTRARAINVALAVTIESMSNLWTKLESEKFLLEASKRENLALMQELLAMK